MKVFFFCVFQALLSDVRKKSHESGALDGHSELSLVLRAGSGSLLGLHSSVRIEKLLEDLGILVVDVFDIIRGKIALFHIFLISIIVPCDPQDCKLS